MKKYILKMKMNPTTNGFSVLDFLESEYDETMQLVIVNALVELVRKRMEARNENKSLEEVEEISSEVAIDTGEQLRSLLDQKIELEGEENDDEESEEDDDEESEESENELSEQEEFLNNFEDLFLEMLDQIEDNNWKDAICSLNGFENELVVDTFKAIPSSGSLILELKEAE